MALINRHHPSGFKGKIVCNYELNVGILHVQKNVSAIENDVTSLYLEKLLTAKNSFKIITIRRKILERNSSKLKIAIKEWITAKNVDLMFIIGNVNPLSALKSFNSEEIFHCMFTLQEEYYECGIKALNRSHLLRKNNSLLVFLPSDFTFYEGFFAENESEILAQLHLMKTKEKIKESISRDCSWENERNGYHGKSRVDLTKVAERPRHSRYPMISMKEAMDIILVKSCSMTIEEKSVHDSYSCILAEDLIATEPYPSFPASIKDGYAVLADDTSTVRRVIGVVTPGCKLDFDICPGTCVRVSTGSAVPDAADAVIQVEDTTVAEKDDEGNEIRINILKPAKLHQDIRSIGSDVALGQVLVPKHTKITSAEIGIMAVCGIQRVKVYRKPWVALLSTGDEVVEPDSPLMPGCIRDSNKSSLKYMLIENRIPVIDAGIARDCPDDVKSRLVFAFDSADIVITTGGVSMGERDILKQVLEVDFGARIHFGRIHMKPGKPTTFSTAAYKDKLKLIFSLPGNPVSAYVCFYLFVLPCIKNKMGYKQATHATIKVELASDLKLDERPEFARVFLEPTEGGNFLAYSTGSQQSSRLLSMQNADALLVLPPKTKDCTVLTAGTKVDAIPLKTI